MIWIKGGHFRMGSDDHHPEEAPSRVASVDGFWIDSAPVTNRQFERFVRAASWVTTAEREASPLQGAGGQADVMGPASLVFKPPPPKRRAHDFTDGWSFVGGADWRHPTGPGSSTEGMEDHPVVHVSWDDVSAYCAWARTDLPTESEWEYAARGGLEEATYAWGEELSPGDREMANIWHGDFPFEHLTDDGWARTSPVASFPANGYGLYDMIGNVWEWTRDWWSTRTGAVSAVRCCSAKNRSGGWEGLSDDPALAHLKIPRRVLKGGSHLCAENYCGRFRPAARQPMSVDTSASHVGFRCVVRPSMMR
jgi:formylglycine-generating enzyme required for sulfatase activity